MSNIILASFFLIYVSGAAQEKLTTTYPEHGIVVALRARSVSPGVVLGPNHGITVNISHGSYRVETDTRFYELSDRSRKPTLTIGQAVEFRIEKRHAYVKRQGTKEQKYRIIGEELKPKRQ